MDHYSAEVTQTLTHEADPWAVYAGVTENIERVAADAGTPLRDHRVWLKGDSVDMTTSGTTLEEVRANLDGKRITYSYSFRIFNTDDHSNVSVYLWAASPERGPSSRVMVAAHGPSEVWTNGIVSAARSYLATFAAPPAAPRIEYIPDEEPSPVPKRPGALKRLRAWLDPHIPPVVQNVVAAVLSAGILAGIAWAVSALANILTA